MKTTAIVNRKCKKCGSEMNKAGAPISMSNTKMQTWKCASCGATEYEALGLHK
jgi:hypothetical protein